MESMTVKFDDDEVYEIVWRKTDVGKLKKIECAISALCKVGITCNTDVKHFAAKGSAYMSQREQRRVENKRSEGEHPVDPGEERSLSEALKGWSEEHIRVIKKAYLDKF